MAEPDSDLPQDPDEGSTQGAVPDPHRGEPVPPPDSHTRSAPDADMTRPDQQEELGPFEGLMHASLVEAKAEVSDDPENEAEAARLGVEGEGVEAAQIFGLLLATGVALALAVVGVFFLVAHYSDAERAKQSRATTYTEVQEAQNRATELLTQHGRTEDAYRMPITDAMAQVAEGYYSQQSADAQPAPTHFNTVHLNASTGNRPADSLRAAAQTPADSAAVEAADTTNTDETMSTEMTDAEEASAEANEPEER